jgi:membrane-associated phospholipid phosphatase
MERIIIDFLYNWLGLNKSLFISINKLTNISYLPSILQIVSDIFFIANFALFYFAACLLLYFRTRRTAINKKNFFMTGYFALARIGICYALFGFTFAALKFSVNLKRPFCSLAEGNFITIANTSLERCFSSFPSAHTGLSILLAYSLWPYMNKSLKGISCLVILAVAASRITLAMHYPADIIYSAVVTILIILAGNFVFKILKNKVTAPIGSSIFRLIFS